MNENKTFRGRASIGTTTMLQQQLYLRPCSSRLRPEHTAMLSVGPYLHLSTQRRRRSHSSIRRSVPHGLPLPLLLALLPRATA